MEKFNQTDNCLTRKTDTSKINEVKCNLNCQVCFRISSEIWSESFYRDTVNVLTMKAEYLLVDKRNLDFCLFVANSLQSVEMQVFLYKYKHLV